MARLINNKILFIHSAKTGGTFVRETINRYGIPNYEVGPKHASYHDIIKAYPEYANLSSFGYVRNPLTWYKSRWAYGMMTYFGEKIKYMPEAMNHWMAPVWSNDLNMFVYNTLNRYPHGIAWEYFNRMLGIGEPEGLRVKNVFRYENVVFSTTNIIAHCKNDFTKISEIQRLPKTLSSSKYKDEISPELQKEIQVVEKQMFNSFY